MYLLTCEFYLKMALQRLAKTLDELQKGGEHDVAQEDIITWFGIGDRASKMVGRFARDTIACCFIPSTAVRRQHSSSWHEIVPGG